MRRAAAKDMVAAQEVPRQADKEEAKVKIQQLRQVVSATAAGNGVTTGESA